MSYISVQLTSASQERLKRWWVEAVGKELLTNTYCHHMTIKFEPGYIREFVPLRALVTLEVVGYAAESDCQAVLVRCRRIRSHNTHPHVTVATGLSTKPVYSKTLLANYPITFIDQPLVLFGTSSLGGGIGLTRERLLAVAYLDSALPTEEDSLDQTKPHPDPDTSERSGPQEPERSYLADDGSLAGYVGNEGDFLASALDGLSLEEGGSDQATCSSEANSGERSDEKRCSSGKSNIDHDDEDDTVLSTQSRKLEDTLAFFFDKLPPADVQIVCRGTSAQVPPVMNDGPDAQRGQAYHARSDDIVWSVPAHSFVLGTASKVLRQQIFLSGKPSAQATTLDVTGLVESRLPVMIVTAICYMEILKMSFLLNLDSQQGDDLPSYYEPNLADAESFSYMASAISHIKCLVEAWDMQFVLKYCYVVAQHQLRPSFSMLDFSPSHRHAYADAYRIFSACCPVSGVTLEQTMERALVDFFFQSKFGRFKYSTPRSDQLSHLQDPCFRALLISPTRRGWLCLLCTLAEQRVLEAKFFDGLTSLSGQDSPSDRHGSAPEQQQIEWEEAAAAAFLAQVSAYDADRVPDVVQQRLTDFHRVIRARNDVLTKFYGVKVKCVSQRSCEHPAGDPPSNMRARLPRSFDQEGQRQDLANVSDQFHILSQMAIFLLFGVGSEDESISSSAASILVKHGCEWLRAAAVFDCGLACKVAQTLCERGYELDQSTQQWLADYSEFESAVNRSATVGF